MSKSNHLRVTALAFAALDLDHFEAAEQALAPLPLHTLRKIGETADRLSALAYTLAGPRSEPLPEIENSASSQPPLLEWANHLGGSRAGEAPIITFDEDDFDEDEDAPYGYDEDDDLDNGLDSVSTPGQRQGPPERTR